MARPARALHLPLHADIMFMAERRGGLLRKAHKPALEARRLRLGRRPASRHQPLRRRTQPRPKPLSLDRRSGQNYRRCQTRAPSVRFRPLAFESADGATHVAFALRAGARASLTSAAPGKPWAAI